VKKLLVGSALLSFILTMSACDESAVKKNESPKNETVVKKIEGNTKNKQQDTKSEINDVQNEMKDLRTYAREVELEQEKKAKELTEQQAREEAERKRQAEIAEQQRQQKITAQQAEQKSEEESPVSEETIKNYEANQAETWAEEAEIEAELNAEEDTQSKEFYEKRAAEERANLKEGETPKWTGDPWVDSQTEWAEMTPEEQKQWQEDNLGDLDEDIQYDENGNIVE